MIHTGGISPWGCVSVAVSGRDSGWLLSRGLRVPACARDPSLGRGRSVSRATVLAGAGMGQTGNYRSALERDRLLAGLPSAVDPIGALGRRLCRRLPDRPGQRRGCLRDFETQQTARGNLCRHNGRSRAAVSSCQQVYAAARNDVWFRPGICGCGCDSTKRADGLG